MTHFADRWTYDGRDPCARFFTACLREARYDIPPGSRVLEIGCHEYPWLADMERYPDIHCTGIDWRPTPRGIQGDVLTHDFERESFDAIVSISTIEHIGLGHYDDDPLDPEGDINALARAWTWLKPGGVLYFDVPFQPSGYRVVGASHREYDYTAVQERLWIEPLGRSKTRAKWRWEGYARAGSPEELQTTRPMDDAQPFWYIGLVWEKVG